MPVIKLNFSSIFFTVQKAKPTGIVKTSIAKGIENDCTYCI